MSEEILKALMELFALIVKQDGGILDNEREYVINFLIKQLNKEAVSEYLALFDNHAGPVVLRKSNQEISAPSVKDSVKIFNICKKINRTLNQEQKVVVLMRLYELVNADRQFTPQRMNIINTVAEVFKISQQEFAVTEQFVKNDDPAMLDDPSILIISPEVHQCELCKKMQAGYEGSTIFILRIASVDLYFIKYISYDQLYLNGLPITSGQVYTFAKGSSVKSVLGYPIYYSDIASRFLSDKNIHKLSFTVQNLTYKFHEGHTAIDNISFSVEDSKLIGIMGASGSGKTTLLNLMSGIQKPTSGNIKINGVDLLNKNESLEGIIGYVPQDDLLIEDLTVFENLYFAACQCFRDKKKEEINKLVDQTLMTLGLFEKRNLKVGSPLNKTISGGQRKRLNIALELIREPSILFLDEPTSGLSSRDSENMMDLLHELTLKGKLVVTVIHQPSSDIFKMFDKIIILDQGGCMIYFGNPVESLIYFKTLDAQINSNIGECPACGNVNPENLFNIIEIQVVDEFGRYTEKRKVKPHEWSNAFNSKFPYDPVPDISESPHTNLQRPGLFRQFEIYLSRDFKSKIANKQYVLLTLLTSPVLGFILSFIIRYIVDPSSSVYIFSDNENIPIYIFMSIIVSLFLGLTISGEEIFRDRKILKREHFLNLSRGSYLFAKISILMLISALQSFLFLAIANPVLGIKGLFFIYWLALFSTSFCANMIGLNISASFDSAIAIYIVLPLLMIPMMVLSGAMFPFDKLNRTIGSVDKVPVIAELMPTRWTYEALMVGQFKDNRYSKLFYDLDKEVSQADFNIVYRLPALAKALTRVTLEYKSNFLNNENPGKLPLINNKELTTKSKLLLIRNELTKLSDDKSIRQFSYIDDLTPEKFNLIFLADSLTNYLDRLKAEFTKRANKADSRREKMTSLNREKLDNLYNDYYNLKLADIVKKTYEKENNKVLEYKNNLVQNYDPIFLEPANSGFLSFRTHFFSPSKMIFGKKADTYFFNISLVLLCTILMYVPLYFELLRKIVRFLEKFKLQK
jgi:ABC-type multidrug transport system ATPase subunit/ABC-type multidrug transport system permease subunit